MEVVNSIWLMPQSDAGKVTNTANRLISLKAVLTALRRIAA